MKGITEMIKTTTQEKQIKLPSGKYPMTFSEFLTIDPKAPNKKIGEPAYYFTSGHRYDSDKNQIDLVTYKKRNKELFLFIEELEDSERSALECCLKIQKCINKATLKKCHVHVAEWLGIPYETIKEYKIIPGIIVFEGSRPSKEFKNKLDKKLQKVVKQLGIKVIHANWNRYFKKGQIMGGVRCTEDEILQQMRESIYSGVEETSTIDFFECYARTKDTNEYYQELFIKCIYEACDNLKEFFNRVYGIRLDNVGTINKDRQKYVQTLFRKNPLKKDLGNIIEILGKPKNSLKYCLLDIPFVTYNEVTNELFFVSTIYRSSHYTSLCLLFSFYNCWDNINQDELIEELVQNGKIPTKDIKPQYAVVVDKDVYPGIELKDNSRKQLQKAVKELGIKVYYL